MAETTHHSAVKTRSRNRGITLSPAAGAILRPGGAGMSFVQMPKMNFEVAFTFWADYLKHLTTLSTGAILLMATFLEKLFAHPHWKLAAAGSLFFLLVSLLGCFGALTFIALNSGRENMHPEFVLGAGWGLASVIIAWVGFFTGITLLTLFAIKNIAVS
jgi:hypothetical protein